MLGRLLCCALFVALVAARAMPPAPLQQKVMGFKEETNTEDVGFNSRPYSRPTTVKSDNIVFDPNNMPHPDKDAVMAEGPDRTYVPKFESEEEAEPSSVHTTHRNMVYKGLASANERQSVSQDVLDQLERLDNSDMPRDPSTEEGEDCSSEDQVLSVGEAPEFSRTPVVPTKEARGVAPEVNSYADFASGLPDDSQTEGSAIAKEEEATERIDTNEDTSLNDAASILGPINETRLNMPFKFAGKLQFQCPTDLSDSFEESFGKIFRDALGTAARVPAGNVDINKVSTPTTIDFDIGAPSLRAVYTEVAAVRAFAKAGGITQRMRLNGFPHTCDLVILSLGDGVEEGTMPEPSMSDQLGPPGGLEDEVLSPGEMRERVRAREAMTYGEYSQPARFNMTKLSPHLFKEGNSTAPRTFYVVGRFKFLCPQVMRQTFAAVFTPVIVDGLQSVTDVTKSEILVTVDGKPQPRAPQILLQAEAVSDADAVIVDFEIPAFTLDRAREIQTAIMAFVSDNVQGFGDFVQRRSPYNANIEFALLHIEIHGFDGMVVDVDCDDEEEGEEADEARDSAALNSPLHASNTTKKGVFGKNNATSADCDTAAPKTSLPASDPSARDAAEPVNSADDWQVMRDKPSSPAAMNLPGRAVYDRVVPVGATMAIQTDTAAHLTTIKGAKRAPVPSVHSNHHRRERRVGGDRELGVELLIQSEVGENNHHHPHPEAMQQSLLSEFATNTQRGEDAVAGDGMGQDSMPEPDNNSNVPAGGFPVADNDDGVM